MANVSRAEETTSGGARVELDWDDEDMPNAGEDERRAGHRLVVVGQGDIVNQHKGPLVGPREVVGSADIDSLVGAARDQRRCCSSLPEQIYVASSSRESFDENLFDPLPFHLEIGEDFVHTRISVLTPQPLASRDDYQSWLSRAAESNSCRIDSIRLTDEYGSEPEDILATWPDGFDEDAAAFLAQERSRPRVVDVRVAPAGPMRVEQLLTAGEDVHVLLMALRGARVDARAAAHLVRAGLPHLLSGVPESDWLEVKRQPYNLDAPGAAGTAQKIELAQDVARFANGDTDALLVLGLSSTKVNQLDVVQAVHPAKLATLWPERYQAIIDERVYPAIEGLKIERVDLGNSKGVMLIEIPAQPREYKPFLVHGAIVGDRVEGAFISIVRRRGEASTTLTASNIHAMLAAGRAYLSSGENPVNADDHNDSD